MESYTLTDEEGITHLHVESDMGEERFDDMNSARDKAMSKIKELAESN